MNTSNHVVDRVFIIDIQDLLLLTKLTTKYPRTGHRVNILMLIPIVLVPILIVAALAPIASNPNIVFNETHEVTPRVMAAMYSPRSGEILLGFDVPVTLADGWKDNIHIHALGKAEAVRLDGLGAGARSVLGPDSTCIVYVSLGYDDHRMLAGVTTMSINVAAGTILGPGGTGNVHTTLPVEITS